MSGHNCMNCQYSKVVAEQIGYEEQPYEMVKCDAFDHILITPDEASEDNNCQFFDNDETEEKP